MTNAEHPNSSSTPAPARRTWSPPRLERHASMTVLTQHFFGAPVAQLALLQVPVSCPPCPGGGPNG